MQRNLSRTPKISLLQFDRLSSSHSPRNPSPKSQEYPGSCLVERKRMIERGGGHFLFANEAAIVRRATIARPHTHAFR